MSEDEKGIVAMAVLCGVLAVGLGLLCYMKNKSQTP